MIRKGIISILLSFTMAAACGCGAAAGAGKVPPLPEGWAAEAKAEEGTENTKESSTGKKTETDNKPAAPAVAPLAPVNTIYFYFDTSGSMNRYPLSVYIHASAQKAGAGMECVYMILNKDSKIEEVDEAFALSGKFKNRAVLDVLGTEEIPLIPNGLNVFTTDLQSDSFSSEIGKWLASSGCSGFTFYVFTLDYGGSLEFYTYTSNETKERVSVKNCSFKRDYLMIVCGDDDLVRRYDESFQEHLEADKQVELPYHCFHVSLGEDGQTKENTLPLTLSRHFTDDLANVTWDNTLYVIYGLSPNTSEEVKNIEFTLGNTFVLKKNRKSANDRKNAVRVVCYTVPEQAVPKKIDHKVTVLQYDSKKKTYVESDIRFDIQVHAFVNGLPASDDPALNEKLGGNLVETGTPVLMLVLENQSLPAGLYAVEATVSFDSSKGRTGFREFARAHSAGLEAYSIALQTECEPLKTDSAAAGTDYLHTETGESVYSRLLEFDRIADELIAAGYKAEEPDLEITLRAVIDYRR